MPRLDPIPVATVTATQSCEYKLHNDTLDRDSPPDSQTVHIVFTDTASNTVRRIQWMRIKWSAITCVLIVRSTSCRPNASAIDASGANRAGSRCSR